MSTLSAAKEIVKGGLKKYGKTLVTNAEKFIAGKIANSKWLPLDWKKQVLGFEGKLSLKNTTGEAFTKNMNKRTKPKGSLEDKIKTGGKTLTGAAAYERTNEKLGGPRFKNAFQAAFGESVFSRPDGMTMAKLRTKTLKKLKERKDKDIKKAIAAALKEVKTEKKEKVLKPEKRPANMNKGGMPKKNHAKPGPYGNAYMKGGMAKKKK